MNRRLTPTLWALLGLMAIVAMPVAANASLPSETTKDQRPKTNIGPSGDWPMFGHDPQRTNFNPDETTINAGNVTQLTQRWQRFIGVGSQAPFSAPSVGGGRLFIGSSIASGDNFFAFDAVTGDPLWGENLGYDDDCFLLVGIGSTAAVSGTIVSIGGGDGAYYGLDVTNGDIEWRDPLGAHPDNFAWASPLLAHGRSYYGAASHCFNSFIRGEARAVDLLSGGQQANRYFVPEGTAGASLWNSPALSPDGSKLVVATGNDVSCGAN